MNQQENDNPTVIEDLPVDEAHAEECKGGLARVTPIKTYICPSDPSHL
jgi:hypothetical protein